MTQNEQPIPVLIIAGPTASGKSRAAIAAAREFDGILINADSLQVYRELRILTARPTPAQESLAPHRLYGVLAAAETCSAGRWQDMAHGEIEAAAAAGRQAIIVGGTGLYLKALTEGLSQIPDIPDQVRAEARRLFRQLGDQAFHQKLAELDPDMAARILPTDGQRVTRAYEVMAATGRSLGAWQSDARTVSGPPCRFATLLFDPPRADLYAACEARFERMLDEGAVAEVEALLALGIEPGRPAMKALGVAELSRYLAGEITLAAAAAAAKQATRNYAKRQMTWFRNQIDKDLTVNAQYSERESGKIFSFIRNFLLTAQR